MVRYFMIPKLDDYQHYKHRNPPWIKLHRSVMSDWKHAGLPDGIKWHLAAIWLLASAHDNKLPFDDEIITNMIHANTKTNLNLLLSEGFICMLDDCKHDASTALSDCKQSALSGALSVEKSREREEKRREENNYCLQTSEIDSKSLENCPGVLAPESEKNATTGTTELPTAIPADIEQIGFGLGWTTFPSGTWRTWSEAYPVEWIRAAMLTGESASSQGKRISARYVSAILQSYQKQGGPDRANAKGNNGRSQTVAGRAPGLDRHGEPIGKYDGMG